MEHNKFVEALNKIQEYNTKIQDLHDLGVDLYEIGEPLHRVISILWYEIYNEYGVDWIDWFIYENDMGKNKMGAWDENKKPICYDVDSLYDHIKNYRKNKEKETE